MSVHRRPSQIAMVKAVTITVDSLPPRPTLDCDGGYNVAMKGASVVVEVPTDCFSRSSKSMFDDMKPLIVAYH